MTPLRRLLRGWSQFIPIDLMRHHMTLRYIHFAEAHAWRSRMRSQILGTQAGALGDAGEHLGADFIAVVKREDEVRPTRALQDPVRSTLALDAPSEPRSAPSTTEARVEDHCMLLDLQQRSDS
jgi:hypothetical protein